MIANSKDLYNLIDNILKPKGFVRKKDTYYLHTSECICFFSIGKSPYGGHYDHVMGCFLKAIIKVKDEFPKYYKNHLKFNIADIAGKEIVKKAFELENKEFVKDEREIVIKDLIENYVIPFLNDVSSVKGILKAIEKYENLKYYVVSDLQDYLGITIE